MQRDQKHMQWVRKTPYCFKRKGSRWSLPHIGGTTISSGSGARTHFLVCCPVGWTLADRGVIWLLKSPLPESAKRRCEASMTFASLNLAVHKIWTSGQKKAVASEVIVYCFAGWWRWATVVTWPCFISRKFRGHHHPILPPSGVIWLLKSPLPESAKRRCEASMTFASLNLAVHKIWTSGQKKAVASEVIFI